MEEIQYSIYGNIVKLQTNFKKTPKDRLSSSYISSRLQYLEDLFKKFCDNHDKIILSNIEKEKSDYFVEDIYDKCVELYLDLKTTVSDKLLSLQSVSIVQNDASVCATSMQAVAATKLPAMALPTFSGDYYEWISFKDRFMSLIHNNVNISLVNKCHYLKGSLQGEAAQLVKQYSVTENNYPIIWEVLNNRFDNKRAIVKSYISKLLGQKRTLVSSMKSIREIINTTNECLDSLKVLSCPIEHWDDLVVHIVLSKLDKESHEIFEQTLTDDTLPTWKQLNKFLESRFRTLENLQDKDIKSVVKKSFKTEISYNLSCVKCGENHRLWQCTQFNSCNMEERRRLTAQNDLCFNCLRKGHSAKKCLQSTRCRLCHRKHHSLLHDNNKVETTNKEQLTSTSHSNETQQATETSTDILTCNTSMPRSTILLATALVNIHANNTIHTLRALIDQGSQASIITESACQLLNLRRNHSHTTIIGVESKKSTSKSTVQLHIKSKHNKSFGMDITAYVLNKLTTSLPSHTTSIDWPMITKLQLADPMFCQPGPIDLILGADVYGRILKNGLYKFQSLIAQNTYLGWIVSGECTRDMKNTHNKLISYHCQVDELLKKFWEMEDIHIIRPTPQEKKCEIYYNNTYTRVNGRYIVRLPFEEYPPDLGSSRTTAEKRLLHMENKFKKNPTLHKQYIDFMDDYLKQNHMELVTPEKENENKNMKEFYLPHHCVINEQHLTTKLRVVFDGSAKSSNGKSLNDNLLIGPALQSEIRDIVLRWRQHKFIIIGDLKQMYRQILIANEDLPYQKILWRRSVSEHIQTYHLKTVTYGTSCAPYLAIKTIKQLASDEQNNFSQDVINMLINDFYVDDLVSGCNNKDAIPQIQMELTHLLQRGGFTLHKMLTNVKPIESQDVRLMLGLTYNVYQDSFQLHIDLPKQKNYTKRTLLSDIGKIYDPLGWLSPITITAKILLQQVWMAQKNWDDDLPDELRDNWIHYRKELISMPTLHLPRWYGTDQDDVLELHGFCDASLHAYAGIVYLRRVKIGLSVQISLVEAKTKVAPIKTVSLPRLELCGAVLVAKLLHRAYNSLNIPIGNVYAWTDSTIVLSWLQRDPRCWTTFVANRVGEIIELVDKTRWRHVASQDNPADVASRGLAPRDLQGHGLWWSGPPWLSDFQLPQVSEIVHDTTLESAKLQKVICKSIVSEGDNRDIVSNLFSKYSSYKTLIHVIAYCLRFYNNCKIVSTSQSNRIKYDYLTPSELQQSLNICIKISQQVSFGEQILLISKSHQLPKGNKLLPLCPFLDNNSILRVKGRLENAFISYSKKHPIILDGKCKFVKLLILNIHHKTLHASKQSMINVIRNNYWIFNLSNEVKKCIHNCVTCVRQTAQPMSQLMGNLPPERLTPSRPFSISGVDFAGPVTLKASKLRGTATCKAYIAVFICLSVKAVHLELVSSLESNSFIAAFKRFVARRGHCHELWSDCGTNFIGANKQLVVMRNQSKINVPPDLLHLLADDGTTWKFNPPSAPHMGGIWESAVRSVKFHLKRVLGDGKLTFEEYYTVLTEIEACINSRPLTHNSSNDPDNPLILTPAHFLIGEALLTVPDDNSTQVTVNYHNRWKYLQQLLKFFWSQWSREYIVSLQRRYKWNSVKTNINLDDIVIVKEDNLPPSKWCLGRVVALYPGLDNLVRVVKLKCKGSYIKRPIHKLCLIPKEP